MKKIFKIFSILALASLLFSCADGLDERNDRVYEKSAGSRTLVEESAQNTTINVHVNRLRKRFDKYPEFEIKAIRGLGYKAVKKIEE